MKILKSARGRKPKYGTIAYMKRYHPESLSESFKDADIQVLAKSSWKFFY